MSGNLLSYQSAKYTSDGLPDLSHSETSLGLLSAGGGVRLAFGLANDMLIGGRVSLARLTSDTDGSPSTTTTTVAVAPTFEYLLADSGAVRPFLGLLAGYQRTSTGGSGADVVVHGFTGGPFAGMHVFAAEGFSFDPELSLAYNAGSTDVGNSSMSAHGFTVGLSVAFSGWLGTSKPASAPTTTPVSSVVAPAAPVGAPKPPAAPPAVAPPKSAVAVPALDRVSAPVLGENKGVLTLAFSVEHEGRDTKAIFSGTPAKDPQWVDLTVVRSVPLRVAAPACESMAFEFEGQSYPFSAVDTKAGDEGSFSRTLFDRGRIEAKTIHALWLAHPGVKLLVCGRTWVLNTEFIDRVHDFDGALRKRPTPSNGTP